MTDVRKREREEGTAKTGKKQCWRKMGHPRCTEISLPRTCARASFRRQNPYKHVDRERFKEGGNEEEGME